MATTDLSRRVEELETKMDTVWDQTNRHIAGCEKLGQAALEARERMEKNLSETRTRMEIIGSELTVKLDKIITRQNEQDGALKAGKALYLAFGVIAAGGAWIATHIMFIK